MTVTEVAAVYNVTPQAVREAAARGWIRARKSGATWLIRRRDADGRWGKTR
jgi:excisionase family DNA binding protein